MSILRFAGVGREVGTFVILDEIEAAIDLVTGSASLARTAPARRP